ncbi:MAG: hypothetical protein A3D92_12255 [Bacteroidetes bacterium RIFCSPHIGHO2_02_FULL_44_7]|nr:MAG: hypothetical protein A3D92_12255 [Bacteroidetes bacterium RIFCSPHIGHO2_02_FULL_44_7]
MAFFSPDFLRFFMDLAPNNNKDWFDANRKRYEENVREPFKKFVDHLIEKVAVNDPAFRNLEAKDCIFRINRDIRFSKDKTPYKMNVSAVIAPEGKKSKAVNGVYFELGPEHLRVYGGIYEIEKDDLLSVREGIAAEPEKFKKLYSDPAFVEMFGEVLGDKNKILPAHLKEPAGKEALIFNKQWYFYTEFPAEDVLRDDLDEVILKCFEVGKPIEQFFNALIQR